MANTVHVAVAVIINSDNEVCISLRHDDAHQGGLWEFPGGKIETGESVEQALLREIKEELGLHISASQALIKISHNYIDKAVCLHVHKVLSFTGEAVGMEGQLVKWLPLKELNPHNFPDANRAIINALLLPDKYLITGKFIDLQDFNQKLLRALSSDIKLVQLRLKENSVQDNQQARRIIESAVSLCRAKGARLMLNLAKSIRDELDLTGLCFSGFHLDSQVLRNSASERRVMSRSAENKTCSMNDSLLLSASCHNREELKLALRLQADFIVLSPVQLTASHPEIKAMGWFTFGQLIDDLAIPVYALGGVDENDLERAKQHGAQGVAAISAFWS